MSPAAIDIREFDPADSAAVIHLLSLCIGWQDDARHAALFRWKHLDNPFGRSFAWVATADGKIVGFRAFMRWRFMDAGVAVEAARAVDTATHPDFRGSGVFSRLTLHGLDELRAAHISFVFNTPNARSLPLYRRIGWDVWGRLPVVVRPASLGGLVRMIRSRGPAELWPDAPAAGTAPGAAAPDDVLAEERPIEALLATQPAAPGIVTARSPAFLRWRYAGLPALGYRAECGNGLVADGFVLYRVRRRRAAVEAVVATSLTPGGDSRLTARLARAAVRQSGADYALALARPAVHPGFIPLPRTGPTLVWRPVTPGATRPRSWRLEMGDIELF